MEQPNQISHLGSFFRGSFLSDSSPAARSRVTQITTVIYVSAMLMWERLCSTYFLYVSVRYFVKVLREKVIEKY